MVNDAQDKQAAKMLKRTEANLPQLQVGDNVRVAIPKVDRGRADSPNVIGVITDVTQHGNYKVGTKHGQLKGSLARNAVEKCKQKTFLTPESVPDAELSVRQTASHVSFGQGFLHCTAKLGVSMDAASVEKAANYAIVVVILTLPVKIKADMFVYCSYKNTNRIIFISFNLFILFK